MKAALALVIGLLVLLFIVVASLTNKSDLKRLQELKNKRRFGGKRLALAEEQELNELMKRYWWY
jgi:prolyl-tRNA editing enzyme YbaK/EbsC (Cys-tRNA(Pro) deacylase)